jgi:hypothetical protein
MPMSFLPSAIMTFIANQFTRMPGPALQSRMPQLLTGVGQSGGDHLRGGSRFGQTIRRLFQQNAGESANSAVGGRSGSAQLGTSSSSPVAAFTNLLRQLSDLIHQAGSPAGGSGLGNFGSSAAKSDRSRPGFLSHMADRWAENQSSSETPSASQDWRKTGWGNRSPGGQKAKRFSIGRAARLKWIAQRRLQQASAAVKASSMGRNLPGWHASTHAQLVARRRAATQRLDQATTLQARATNFGAVASGRVAHGLAALAGKLPGLAFRLASPNGIASTLARLPLILSKLNDTRIASLRAGRGDYNGQMAAAFAKYDLKTENIKALNARDTQASTNWLIDEQNKLRTALRPFQVMTQNAFNNVQAGTTMALRKTGEGISEATKWIGSAVAEGENYLNGKGFRFDRMRQIKEQVDKDAAARIKEEEKVFDRQFTNHLGGWVAQIENKKEARRNAMPKHTLPKLK